MDIGGHLIRTGTIFGLVFLVLVACGSNIGGSDIDGLAIQIGDLHDDVDKMTNSIADAIAGDLNDICPHVRRLDVEADRLPTSGSPESLVRMAGFELREACTQLESALEREEEVSALFTRADVVYTVTHSDWQKRTEGVRERLEHACGWLRAYDVVAEPEYRVGC